MADSLKKITPESTLQDVLDYQYSHPVTPLRSIIIRDRNGECTVPKNVNVRFYNCTFSSFNCTENNTFFFRGCAFKGTSVNFKIEGANIIADGNTSFETKCQFKNTSLQLLRCKISSTQAFDNVQLVSINNTWTGGSSGDNQVGIVAKNSRIISVRDYIENWANWFVTATTKTYIKIDSAIRVSVGRDSSSEKGFLSLKESSADIWNIKALSGISSAKSALFKLVDSSLFINTDTVFNSDYSIFDCTNSNVSIENSKKITSTKADVVLQKDGNFSIKNVQEFSCSANGKSLFKTTGLVNIKIDNVKELKCIGKMFDFEQAYIYIFGDKTGIIQGQNDTLFSGTKASTLVLKNIDSISSTKSNLFNIVDSTLNVSTVKTITGAGTQSYVLKLLRSSATFSNINAISASGDDTFRVENSSNLSLLDVKKVENTRGNAINLLYNSKLICKQVSQIKGKLNAESSFCIIKNCDKIIGIGGKAITGNNSKLLLADIGQVSGSISGNKLDVIFYNKQTSIVSDIGDITVDASGGPSKELSFEGPLTVGKANFTNCIIRGTNVTWNGAVTLTNSYFVENISSIFKQAITGNNSYVSGIGSIHKNISLNNNSVLDIIKGSAEVVSLTDGSSISGRSSTLSSLSITNTGASIMASTLGNVTQSGKSSFLGLGLNNKALTFASDPSITGVSFLTTSGGNLGLQADTEVITEGNYIRQFAREEITQTAPVKISSTVNSVTSVVIEPTQITSTATALMTLSVPTSSIIINPTSVTITGI
jgi:hypothetical protein